MGQVSPAKGIRQVEPVESARLEREKTARRTYDAPEELATPTDLTPEAARDVSAALNPLIADAYALYVKTKNYHWHLAGSHFREYHKLFDEQAEEIFESIDMMAERVRRIGGTTIRSVGHISGLQRIVDDDEEFVPATGMIERLLADNRLVAKAQRAAMELCDEKRDHPTSNLLQELLDQTEKRIWFLFETSRGREHEL